MVPISKPSILANYFLCSSMNGGHRIALLLNVKALFVCNEHHPMTEQASAADALRNCYPPTQNTGALPLHNAATQPFHECAQTSHVSCMQIMSHHNINRVEVDSRLLLTLPP
jgi:hypothetical protein